MSVGSKTWRSIPQIAADLGASPLRVEEALVTIGIVASDLNSRQEANARVYSPAAVALVRSELGSASR